jgi:hypothetical protein
MAESQTADDTTHGFTITDGRVTVIVPESADGCTTVSGDIADEWDVDLVYRNGSGTLWAQAHVGNDAVELKLSDSGWTATLDSSLDWSRKTAEESATSLENTIGVDVLWRAD